MQRFLKNLTTFFNPKKLNLAKKYLDHFSLINSWYNKIYYLFTESLITHYKYGNIKILLQKKFINYFFTNNIKNTTNLLFLIYSTNFIANFLFLQSSQKYIKNQLFKFSFKNLLINFSTTDFFIENIIKTNNLSVKPYFIQSIRSIKKNPITFF